MLEFSEFDHHVRHHRLFSGKGFLKGLEVVGVFLRQRCIEFPFEK